jgi:Uma2 family endonuclease
VAIQPTRRRFTVEEYYAMVPAGVLHEDSRVELIDGEIIDMTPIGSPHASTVNRFIREWSRWVGERALVSAQNPLRLSDLSEPEPDFMLLAPRSDDYAEGHPGPTEVFLLVEVSDSSLAYDRGVKVPLYARSGIPEVWIVDLAARAIEVHRRPGPDGYGETFVVGIGDTVAPLAFPDHEMEVGSIVG